MCQGNDSDVSDRAGEVSGGDDGGFGFEDDFAIVVVGWGRTSQNQPRVELWVMGKPWLWLLFRDEISCVRYVLDSSGNFKFILSSPWL